MFNSEKTFSSKMTTRTMEEREKENKRVIFLYEPGVDWFPVFLALMRASVVPCVVYPIDPMTTARDVLRERYEFLKTLAKECASRVQFEDGDGVEVDEIEIVGHARVELPDVGDGWI